MSADRFRGKVRRPGAKPGLPAFSFVLVVPGAPDDTWGRLWDDRRHTAAVPLTTALFPPAAVRAGSKLIARTAIGRLGFDDVMNVVVWRPPHRAQLRKVGRVLQGSVRVELTEHAASNGPATRVSWSQSVVVSQLPAALVRPVIPLIALGYRTALRKILDPNFLT